MRHVGLDGFSVTEALSLSAVGASLFAILCLGALHAASALTKSPPPDRVRALRQIQGPEDAREGEAVFDVGGRLHAIPSRRAGPAAIRQVQWVEDSSGLLAIVIPCQGPTRYYRVPSQSWLNE